VALTLTEREPALRTFIESVVGVRDPIGVLSATVGIEAGPVSGGRPAWEITIENDLATLRRGGALGRAPRGRLDELSAHVAELVDPAAAGRGRALYVALESGSVHEAALPRALPTGARVGPVAHVLPLLQALEEGVPAGLITSSKDMVVIFESELGRAHEIDRIELEPWVGDWWPEMKGPSRANPLRGQHTVSQRDRYSRRIAEAYRHTLHDACEALSAVAARRRWSRAVLAGDPRTIDSLRRALQDRGLSTTTIGGNLESLRSDQALERLESALEQAVVEDALVRARGIVEDAAAGGRGACGLEAVLVALNQARVASLLVDPSRTFPGIAESAEILLAADDDATAVDLTDLIVSRCLATGAVVVPLSGDAAGALGGCGGIAAGLRW